MASSWFRNLALVGSVLAVAEPVLPQVPPPNLRQVGDHWTAWDPPTSFPEGTQVRIIEEGDTLWDLAESLYGDPYLWPQIWERNRYILDAHWIYPGDPLVLGIEVAPATDTLETTDTGTGPGPGPGSQAGGAEAAGGAQGATLAPPSLLGGGGGSSFIQLGKPSDIYCSGYIGEFEEKFGYRIVGSEYEVLGPTLSVGDSGKIQAQFGAVDTIKYGMYLGDIVYLDGGRGAGISPGDIFTAVRRGETIPHPFQRRWVGRLYVYLGRVRVLSVQETSAIAEVSHSCEPMVVGTLLKPFEPEPVPSERVSPMRPVNQPTSRDALRNAPTILYARDGLVSLGGDHVVYIDQGENADVTPGDIYTIYRLTTKNSPPLVIGELAVLSVHPISSVAKIIRARYPVYVGDLLDLK